MIDKEIWTDPTFNKKFTVANETFGSKGRRRCSIATSSRWTVLRQCRAASAGAL